MTACARSKRGAARIGVLLFILVVVTGAYVGVSGDTVNLNYGRFRDQMVVNSRLAQTMDDPAILRQLHRAAGKSELPRQAKATL